jgi:CheY-like chemotaxis protein
MLSSKGKGLVLVVDDDADIRDAIKDVLEDEGYRTAEAADGLEALNYLRVNPPPPLILLDWNMAPMNGPQFMTEFMKQPESSRVPVVLLTADPRGEEKARGNRFVGHLKKPVKLDDLFAIVEKYCSPPSS